MYPSGRETVRRSLLVHPGTGHNGYSDQRSVQVVVPCKDHNDIEGSQTDGGEAKLCSRVDTDGASNDKRGNVSLNLVRQSRNLIGACNSRFFDILIRIPAVN